jgi:hypothetical protein
MLNVLIAAALSPTTFSGGGASDLAASLAGATQRGAVIAVLDRQNYRKFTFEPMDATQMAQAVLAATGLKQAVGVDLAYHPNRIPQWFAQIPPFGGQGGSANLTLVSPPKVAWKDGKLTWKTPKGEASRVEELQRAFSKPLEWHWTHEPYAMVFHVIDMPEADVLRHIAKAVGGKLAATRDRFRLDFDPEQFRQRARGLFVTPSIQRLENLDEMSRANFELSRSAIGMASSAQIRQAFYDRGGQTAITLGPGQMGMVQQRMAVRLSFEQQPRQTREGGRRGGNISRRLASVDLRQGAAIILRSDFRTEIEAVTVDALGRPVGRVRF